MFPHPTAVHIFRCSTNSARYGATLDPTGVNLPATLCPKGQWRFFNTILVRPGEDPRVALDADELAAAIQDHGWYIWDVTITVQVHQ